MKWKICLIFLQSPLLNESNRSANNPDLTDDTYIIDNTSEFTFEETVLSDNYTDSDKKLDRPGKGDNFEENGTTHKNDSENLKTASAVNGTNDFSVSLSFMIITNKFAVKFLLKCTVLEIFYLSLKQ